MFVSVIHRLCLPASCGRTSCEEGLQNKLLGHLLPLRSMSQGFAQLGGLFAIGFGAIAILCRSNKVPAPRLRALLRYLFTCAPLDLIVRIIPPFRHKSHPSRTDLAHICFREGCMTVSHVSRLFVLYRYASRRCHLVMIPSLARVVIEHTYKIQPSEVFDSRK